MTKDNDSNKAGDTKTTSKEYVKLESGEQDNPKVSAENPGLTSTSKDDLEHPEKHHSEDTNLTHDAVAKKIKDTNKEE